MPQWSIAHWKSSLQPVDSSSPLISQSSSCTTKSRCLFSLFFDDDLFKWKCFLQRTIPTDDLNHLSNRRTTDEKSFHWQRFPWWVVLRWWKRRSSPMSFVCPLSKQENIVIVISPLNKQPSPFSRRTMSIIFYSLDNRLSQRHFISFCFSSKPLIKALCRIMVSCQPVKSTSGLVYIDISQMGTSTILNHFHRLFNSSFICENVQSNSFLLWEWLEKGDDLPG